LKLPNSGGTLTHMRVNLVVKNVPLYVFSVLIRGMHGLVSLLCMCSGECVFASLIAKKKFALG
jgi:hypothetical protein